MDLTISVIFQEPLPLQGTPCPLAVSISTSQLSPLLQVQYSGRNLYQCGDLNTKHATAGCTFVPNGQPVQQALRYNRNPNEVPWEAAALIGWLVVMRAMVYLALRMKTRSKVR